VLLLLLIIIMADSKGNFISPGSNGVVAVSRLAIAAMAILVTRVSEIAVSNKPVHTVNVR
jgi:hypothetical protein